MADALRHELGQPSRTRPKRLTKPPIRLAPDSPLRSLSSAELTVDPRVVLIDQPSSAHARHGHANVAGREPSPNLWTDAWLVALAQSLRCRMVTFGRGFKSFPKLDLHLLSV